MIHRSILSTTAILVLGFVLPGLAGEQDLSALAFLPGDDAIGPAAGNQSQPFVSRGDDQTLVVWQAKELLDAVAAVIKDASAIAFEAEVRIKIQMVEIAQKAQVLLKRPNLARLELSGAGQDALIILDGTTSWHYIKASKGFVKSNQLGTAKLEQYGVGPMATLFFEREAGTLSPYLSDAVITKEKLGEEECSVVRWKVGTEETSLWISGDRLRRFRTTRSIDVNVFEQTFNFGAIDLSPTVASDTFAFTPPKGAQPLGGGDESEFLDIGTAAPDFAAMYVDGREMMLSDFKGKPVLLNFWFYGCATCREEFPQLQKLNGEYAARGVMMLAINFGDKPETIAAYFEKEGLTLTPLRQQKDEVSKAFGVQTYPTTYILGPDGKIAWRALGFDEAAIKLALDNVALRK